MIGFAHRGEKARWVLSAGIGLAALTLACAGLLLWHDRQRQIEDSMRNTANLSTTLAAHAEQAVRAADLVLQSLVTVAADAGVENSAEFRRALTNRRIYELLRDKSSVLPQLDVTAIVALNGDVINYSRSFPPAEINVADRDYFRTVMAGPYAGVFLSEPVRNRSNGSWTFYLARQVINSSGAPIGMVLVGLSSEYFSEFYRASRLGRDSAVSLFRADGIMLAREPMPSDLIGRSFKDEVIFRVILPYGNAAEAVITDESRMALPGASRLRILTPRVLRDFPLVSNVTVTEDEFLASWRRTAVLVSGLTGVLVAALLWLTLVLGRQFDRQERTVQELVRARGAAEEAAASKTTLLQHLEQSEARLTQQSAVVDLTLDNIDQGLMMIAADRTVPICNRRAMDLLDLPPELMRTHPKFDDVVAHQRAMDEFAGNAALSAVGPGSATIMTQPQIYERERPNGRILEIQTIPLADGGMVRTYTDITERRRSEEQVRYFAHHDSLTTLYNRVVFGDRLTEAIKRADQSRRAMAVLYLDLDGFKQVNDTHGHGVGDRLLIEVAERLRRMVRARDTLARMGGDEFAIILPMIDDRSDAETLAQRLLSVLGEPFVIGAVRCSVTLSIGISLYPAHATIAEHLLRDADIALYAAKAVGKGAYRVFDETMDRRQQELVQLEQDLRRALDGEQLYLEYQPIVDTISLEVIRFEALLRWRHPVHGVIGPDAFIGMAERTGLIVPIGLWVLETACAEAACWSSEVGVGVNLSPVQFARGELPGHVAGVLARTGLRPQQLNLEVTEGVLLEVTSAVLEAMAELRGLGVRFSLDDFGTAHAGLTYLRRFPFDVIKIDKSFVQDAVEHDEARAIVAAVLAIGRAFRLQVVAEGVETEAQLRLLRELGCEQVQGYFTGRPAGPRRG